jgi:hypothetical protein
MLQEGIYDELAKAVTEQVQKFKLGDGLRDGTTLGPLISAKAVDFVQGHVDDAVQKGAKVGGRDHLAIGSRSTIAAVLSKVGTSWVRVYRRGQGWQGAYGCRLLSLHASRHSFGLCYDQVIGEELHERVLMQQGHTGCCDWILTF